MQGITSGAAKGSAIWLGAIAVQAGQKPRIGEGRTAHVENNFSNDAIVAQARIDHGAGRNCSWNVSYWLTIFLNGYSRSFQFVGVFPLLIGSGLVFHSIFTPDLKRMAEERARKMIDDDA